MRTRWKVLSSILSAVMVLSSLSAIVLADDYKQANGFKYRLVGDELDVICQSHSVILSRAADITSETEISKIVLDVSEVEYQKDNFHSLYCSGVGDIASVTDDVFADVSVLDIVCDEETSFTYIELDGFPGVDSDGLSISEKIMVGDLSLRKFGVDSLDFLDGLDVESVVFTRCNDLEVADMSSYEDLYFHFSMCENLAGVTFPSTLTRIEYGEFFDCYSLKCLELPSSLEEIMPMAFYGCGLQTITLPGSLDEIRDWTFYGCGDLESITVPATITSVDYSAFLECDSLSDVYYAGTEAQWNAIEITNYREYETTGSETLKQVFQNATIHFNYEIPTGWVEVDGSWRLYDSDGHMLTGWQKDNGKWYYLAENGEMRIGWQDYNGKWYYLDPDSGAMKTGWFKDGSKWYYLDPDSGAMKTGWLNDGGKWYYFNGSGAMVTGWVKVDDEWYYFESSGAMYTGWLEDGGTWYYLKSNGAMAAGEYCKGYWLDDNGKWTYKYKFSWKQDSVGWYYIDTSGWYVKGETVTIDGTSYEFDSAGYLKE